MGFLKDLESIFGRIKATTKEILSKDWGVDLDIGAKLKVRINKLIKDTMQWIKNQVMEDMNGRMDGYIKASLKMISEMGMESCLILKIKSFIKDNG